MRILVKVTKDVLERSKMCGIEKMQLCVPTNCAIAVALRDIFPYATIRRTYANLIDGDYRTNVMLPDCAVSFIDDFDSLTPQDRVNMQPFSFELEVPEYVIEKIGIGEIMKVLSESKTLEHINK